MNYEGDYRGVDDETLISELEDEARKELSSWEEGFLSSIREGLEEYGSLTDPQRDKLEEIHTFKGPLS